MDMDRICSGCTGIHFHFESIPSLALLSGTKAILKRKVSKIEMEMKSLGNVPNNDVVIVPGI